MMWEVFALPDEDYEPCGYYVAKGNDRYGDSPDGFKVFDDDGEAQEVADRLNEEDNEE